MLVMQRRGRRSIFRLLFSGYAVVMLLLAATWGAGAYVTSEVHARLVRIVSVDDVMLDTIHTSTKLMDDQETGLRGYLLTGRTLFLQPYRRAQQQAPGQWEQGSRLAQEIPGAAPLFALMQTRGRMWGTWSASILRHPPPDPRARTAIQQQLEGKQLFDRFRTSADLTSRLVQANGRSQQGASERLATALNRVSAAILLLGLCLTIVIGWLTVRALIQPLALLSEAADAIGEGDLDHVIEVTRSREFVGLAQRMDRMRHRLAAEAENRLKAEQDVRRFAERRSAVIRVQQEIAWAGIDLDHVMATITDSARDLTRADTAVIEIVEGDDMVYRAASGSAATHIGLRLNRATSLSGRCVAAGSTVRCDDSEADDRVNREACRAVGARSMVIVPLQQDAEIVGVLKVTSTRPRAFDDFDVSALELVGGTLGGALSKAQTFSALQASERHLRIKTREQEAFLHTVSHDLRSPLVSIQGLVTMLREDHRTELSADALHLIERVHVNADRMQTLLGDLLDLSRIGRIDTEFAPVDVSGVVADVVAQLRPVLDSRHGQVEVMGLLPVVHANATRVSQLFTNLIQNAILYTPADRSPYIRIGACQADGGWELCVADNGIGIPASDRDRVLGLFQRLPSGKRLNPSGTGVGLAIVARVVEIHGGSLTVESADGEGTTFRFTLPRGDDSVASDGEPRDRGPRNEAA